MKYSIIWTVPCSPFIQGKYGSSEQFVITRYGCGNYTISADCFTRRITVRELSKKFPGALAALKKKAGVRKYAD